VSARVMREKELRLAAKCLLCRKPFGASGLPVFYRVRIERFAVDMAATRRQSGLEMMLGGHVALAQIMGPDDVMAKGLGAVEFTVCETCSTDLDRARLPIAALEELAQEEADAKSGSIAASDPGDEQEAGKC